MEAKPARPDAWAQAASRATALDRAWRDLAPEAVVARAIETFGRDGIVAVSSFGADSAVLLHMIASADRRLPVIFLDTGKHFGETLGYRDALADELGLADLRVLSPLASALSRGDPDGMLHARDTDACCAIRKVEPMARAVEPFAAWFTGRKRFQASTRAALPVVEAVGPRIRVNPLATWTADEIGAYMAANGLRQNPLVAYGYLSIGCFPCTQAVAPGEDARAGRWAGQTKTECGIHLAGLESSVAIRLRKEDSNSMTDPSPRPRLWTRTGFTDDPWRHVEAVGATAANERAILPLAAWLALDEETRERLADDVGVHLLPGEAIDPLLRWLDRIPLVSLAFPAFNDGRSYSKAALLRERHRYAGIIRASGDVLIDQIALMLRTGFDAFEVTNVTAVRRLEAGWRGGLPVHYQPSAGAGDVAAGYSWRRRPAD